MNTVAPPLTFPDLLYLNDYNGDFGAYFNSVYDIFEAHFIKSNPLFMGIRVSAQRLPLVDNIHRTFYHITHEGEDENNRTPDFRRMERIRFPKFIIESCPHPDLLIWENIRGRDTRILIFNEATSYLIVLTKRNGYYLFWTAYFVEREHQKKKYIKEYKAYKNAKTA